MISSNLKIAIAGIALALVLYLRKKKDLGLGESDYQALSESEHNKLKNKNRTGIDTELTWGAFFAGIGAVFGPAGIAIGAVVGFFFGNILDWVNHESYGRRVRDSIAQWLDDNGFPNNSEATDAMLLRNALLGATYLYVRPRDGKVAVEIITAAHFGDREVGMGDPPATSLIDNYGHWEPWADSGGFIPGGASMMGRLQMLRLSPGQIDGPNQVASRRAFHRKAKAGELYPLEAVTDKRSWHSTGGKPEFTNFQRWWPRVSDTKISRNEFVKVIPHENNIDLLCAWFDRAAGVTMKRGG